MTYPARTLFVCWLAVVATGTHVAHCHAAEAGHTHGLGWASVGSAGGGLPLLHRHFVLCGVELGADDSCETPDGVRAAFADPIPEPDDGSAEPAVPPADLPSGLAFGVLAPAAGPHPPPLLPAPPAHLRSTVLRL